MDTALLIFFSFLLFLVFIYSLVQLHLLLNFLQSKKKKDSPGKSPGPSHFPFVTIQLPVYNEKPVVERLLKNIALIDYPKDKLEIQVLDDSTDDSVTLTSRLIAEIRNSGLNIRHLRRTDRKGFKAGALKEGLITAKGDLIAIFDSDFLPGQNWLKETIPHFTDDKVGVVQTRWGHLNRNYSLLTRMQAFALDFHFILEQNGRNFGGHFINFNGTAGIWRKACILDAGNWEGDTLTEDLDLSYRAQLRGWKFRYLEEVETPAELPVTIEAARSQQFRWNKGAAENFQKNYLKLLKDPAVSAGTQIHSFFHLLNSSLFLLILILAIVSVPVLLVISHPEFGFFTQIMSFFSISTLIFFVCYWFSFARIHTAGLLSFLRYIGTFFTFFSIAMGFSVHNSIAVLEGHFGKKSEFIRTPKFNITSRKQRAQLNSGSLRMSFRLVAEIFLMLYFALAVYLAFYLQNFSLIIFHLMLLFGFSYVVISSLKIMSIGRRRSDLGPETS